jgi:hypothetical protein
MNGLPRIQSFDSYSFGPLVGCGHTPEALHSITPVVATHSVLLFNVPARTVLCAPDCSIALPDCQAQCFVSLMVFFLHIPAGNTHGSVCLLSARTVDSALCAIVASNGWFSRHRPCFPGIWSRSAYWYRFLSLFLPIDFGVPRTPTISYCSHNVSLVCTSRSRGADLLPHSLLCFY